MFIRNHWKTVLQRLPRLHIPVRPGQPRTWRPEQAVLPQIVFDSTHVHIRNVRDFTFHSATRFTPAFHDQTYEIDSVERVWYVVVPFTRDWRGPAHTFLSFGFRDGQYLGISVEARRGAGEAFSLVKGALRQFELMYVLGTERDLIGLRAVTWDDPVYLYPIRTAQDNVRRVFVGMLRRAEALAAHPEFYHTIWNNCTTNILAAVNQIAVPPIPFGPRILLGGYSDALAYNRGMIDTDLPLAAARERFEVSTRAKAAIDDPAFSTLIRG
jgi:hypothetical protein